MKSVRPSVAIPTRRIRAPDKVRSVDTAARAAGSGKLEEVRGWAVARRARWMGGGTKEKMDDNRRRRMACDGEASANRRKSERER